MLRFFVYTIFSLVLLTFVGLGAAVFFGAESVEEQGGIKQTLINIGQDAKDIMHEISEHDSSGEE